VHETSSSRRDREVLAQDVIEVPAAMVQLLLAFLFGAFGLIVLLYGIVRLTQRDERPLSPARRAWIIGGIVGSVVFLLALAWWAWVAPPGALSGMSSQ
jgi:hypothetical protein